MAIDTAAHRHAVLECRFWWTRHLSLPWWRVVARRRALVQASRWGIIALKFKAN